MGLKKDVKLYTDILLYYNVSFIFLSFITVRFVKRKIAGQNINAV